MKQFYLLCLAALLNYGGNAQTLQWVKTLDIPTGAGGFAQAEKVLVDAGGNVYSYGNFFGYIDFDPGPATYTMSIASFGSGVFILKLDPQGNFLWAKSFPIFGAVGSIALDASGDVYVCGVFAPLPQTTGGNFDFDPGPGVFNMTPTGGDGYIVKLSSSGNFIWASKLGGAGNDYCRSIAVDPSGDLLITGTYQGNVDFDLGSSTYFLNATNGIFVWKLTGTGGFLWAKSFQGSAGTGTATSLTTDGSGNVYTTGSFNGTVDFDPGVSSVNLTAAGQNIYLSKLDASGNYLWANSVVSTSSAEPTSICLDPSTNVYVTGDFTGTHDFDPSSGTYTLTTGFASDAFILKVDASGSFLAANALGGTGADRGNSVVSDAFGNVYITGTFAGVVDFDLSAATHTIAVQGNSDIFIAKYNSSGNLVLALDLGGSPLVNSGGRSIAVDPFCNFYTVGVFNNGTIDFDPDSGSANFTNSNSGSDHSFLLKLNACPLSSGTITGASTLCAGSTRTYSVNEVPWATGYSWTIPAGATILNGAGTNSITVAFGTNSGSIAVTPTNSCGGCNTSTFFVAVSPTPSISASASNTVICQGNTITLNASGANGYSVSGGAFTNQTITPTSSTIYTITGINFPSFCASDPVFVPVTVNPLPVVSINASSLSICGGRQVTLEAVGADSYTWSGSVVNGQGFAPSTTSTYSVTGSFTQTGCTGVPAFVTVSVSPSAAFNYTVNGMQATFSVSGGCSNFLWDFGNGNTSSINPGPVVTYATPGVYSVCFKCNGSPIACLECQNLELPGNIIGGVGIVEREHIAGVSIYPNPNDGEFTIETSKELTVSVVNLLGQVIHEELLHEGKNQLSLSQHGKGIYFLRMGAVTTKVVKE